MTEKHLKECSVFLVIREMQVKPILISFTTLRMTISIKQMTADAGNYVE